jgi:hypothetical protein
MADSLTDQHRIERSPSGGFIAFWRNQAIATIWYQKNRWGWKDRSDHVVGHLFGGSERNPEHNEVSLNLKFVGGDGVERDTIDLDALGW